eukprot:365627-Chlamydomonas_euryale.AAC.6
MPTSPNKKLGAQDLFVNNIVSIDLTWLAPLWLCVGGCNVSCEFHQGSPHETLQHEIAHANSEAQLGTARPR